MRDEPLTTNRTANHPEADLLAAFAEKALTGAETAQVVDHLAGCARCREIVFLAQQAAPSAEPLPEAALWPQPAPARKLWRLPWLPVAASGLTACLLVGSFVWFRSLHPASGGTETAKVQSAPQPMPHPAASAQAEIVPPKASHLMPAEAPRKALTAAPEVHPPEALHGNIAQYEALPAQTLPNQILPAQEAGASGSTGQLQAVQAYRRQAEAKRAMPTAGAVSPANGFAEQSLAAAPVAAAPAASSQTFVSVSAQAVDTVNASQVADAVPSRATLTASRNGALPIALLLPGGHAAVSSLHIPGRILALDAEGALFASDNIGRNWRAISLPWTGKAIALAPLTPPTPDENVGAATAELTVRKSKAQQRPDSIEIRLASGERWISRDRGESWTLAPNPVSQQPPN
jgi:hypothetical protein